jgi:hypothetical protein
VCRELVPAEYEVEQQYKDKVSLTCLQMCARLVFSLGSNQLPGMQSLVNISQQLL